MSNYSDSHFDESAANTSWYKVFHLVPEGSKVLDIGCSSGNFGYELIKRKSCVVDGIELDKADAQEAKKKLNKVFVKNIETDSLSGIDTDYDVIYFGDVIEHLVDPISTLKRVKALLNNRGSIVFSIPNMGHIGIRLALLVGEFEYTETGLLDKTHLHFYTQTEVIRVFEEAGYKIDNLSFVEKDYPKALLEDYLKKCGLKANRAFYKKMQATDASAFQFVGLAKKGSAKRHKLKQFGPIDLFETFFEDTKKNYETRIAELEAQLSSLNQRSGRKNRYKHSYRALGRRVKNKLSR